MSPDFQSVITRSKTLSVHSSRRGRNYTTPRFILYIERKRKKEKGEMRDGERVKKHELIKLDTNFFIIIIIIRGNFIITFESKIYIFFSKNNFSFFLFFIRVKEEEKKNTISGGIPFIRNIKTKELWGL